MSKFTEICNKNKYLKEVVIKHMILSVDYKPLRAKKFLEF